MPIPLEWKASITGVGDVKSKLAELNQEYKNGQITLEEYSQKKNYLTRVTRATITTISRSMSTFGRITSSALSIMNSFNLAQLVTQGQSQQQFGIKLEMIDAAKELEKLQEALDKDPNNEGLKIQVQLQLSKVEELKNQTKALAE